MGSFGGHALPGSFFIVFSVWWTVNQFYRYFTRKKFTSTTTYSLSCGRYIIALFDLILKLVLICIGIIGEVYTGYDKRFGKFILSGNAQHATMFFTFGLTGVVDILLYFKVPLPKDLDYGIAVLALVVEGILFHFHLHGRNELDVRLHTLLVYCIVFNTLAVLAEMKFRNNALVALTRTLFFFVQGTWFWQIGFILYNPNPYAEKWLPADHFQLMMVTIYFTWHMSVVVLVMLVLGSVVGIVLKKSSSSTIPPNGEIEYTSIRNNIEISSDLHHSSEYSA